VLADLRIDGRAARCPERQQDGFMYVIDRTNGKLIAAHPFVKVNLGLACRPQRPAARF